jgi:KaiC/GvpD/RAD55 family RecA-like ATPase
MKGKLSKVKRVGTGVVGFDEMVEGGFPKDAVVGVSGPPGTGKSIFSLQFVLEGARRGEKCVYVNLEEPRGNIDNALAEFDFGDDFLDFEKRGLIVVRCFDYERYAKVSEDLLLQVAEDEGVKRLVVDSFNCFFSSVYDFDGRSGMGARKLIGDVFLKLRRCGATVLLVLEAEKGEATSSYNIHYLVDGLVSLDYLDLGTIERRVFVSKMRWTAQCKEGRSYEIGDGGVVVSENI